MMDQVPKIQSEAEFNYNSVSNDVEFPISRKDSECDRFDSFTEADSGIIFDSEEEIESAKNAIDERFRYLSVASSGLYESPVNRFRLYASRRHSMDNSIAAVSQSPMGRRRFSLQIPSNKKQKQNLQTHIFCGNDAEIHGSQASVVGLGSDLFLAFLREEVHRSTLKVPGWFNECSDRTSAQRESRQADEFVSIGNHLRSMADEFANSDYRQRVRQHAESIPLRELDVASFTDLLIGMFQEGGVTCERVLVLFVFCADLALQALRERLLACFTDIILWAQLYIEDWVSPWVQRQGGWVVLLEQSIDKAYKAAVFGACVMSILALWTYIRTAGR